jgi:hypothetical protein
MADSRRKLPGLLVLTVLLALAALSPQARGQAATEPEKDLRGSSLIDADRFVARIPPVKSLEQWEARRAELRQTVLNSAGLWPPPARNPLNAKIFDEKQGDGFRVAKVYFESLPGYFATGNLYLPASGSGPFPAVVSPHGHWTYGRLNNDDKGSIPGRCIDFARMGFVVFSIDMVGYNDCFQLPHDSEKSRAQLNGDMPVPYEPRFFKADFDFPVAGLYGLNLGGLQAWNCVRAVDFLVSLPMVDSTRIGATGASGGASQTIFLMTVDDRIKVAAPVNIIGLAKHPGCKCENMPGLWVDATTVELGCAFAPRPLLLCSATRDPWTSKFPTRELPVFRKYYALYGAEDRVKNVVVDDDHNYNAQTRAAVYEWFCKWLKAPNPPIKNPVPIAPEMKALGDLRVFPDKILPENALDGHKVIQNWIDESQKAFEINLPRSASELEGFVSRFGPHLARILAVERPAAGDLVQRVKSSARADGLTHEILALGRRGKGDCLTVEIVSPAQAGAGTLVLVYPEEAGSLFLPGGNALRPWIEPFVKKGFRIVRVGGYASGELFIPLKTWESFNWPDTYNRDNRLNGIQDVITALSYVRATWPQDKITLAGLSRCGLITAFAGAISGEADRALVDLDNTDPGYDGELLKLLPVGSIRRVGDFRTASLMLMRKPLVLLNAGPTFEAGWYRNQAAALGLSANLGLEKSEEGLWLPSLLKPL